jgi:hypothetical protein
MRLLGVLVVSLILSSCVAQTHFEPQYLSEVSPVYLAETQIVVLMHDHDQQYVFEGKPESRIGETITLTMPIGAILREVTAEVFRTYFMYGVVFTQELVPDLHYVIAIEPEIKNFSYRYDRQVEGDTFDVRRSDGGDLEAQPVSIITPSIQFDLALKVYDKSNKVLLEKTYPSGVVEGEPYIVTSRPHERINATFHKALEGMLLQVAKDLRPFLTEEEIN